MRDCFLLFVVNKPAGSFAASSPLHLPFGMSSATPPRRRRIDRTDFSSPRQTTEDAPGTPGPTKARIANLNSQVQELVRKHHAAEVRILV